ncbi:peptidase domain-containing ABC transporter [Aequorivita echinoideorum]|uniref:ATP-binding cassette domain-containing protein n=1 Tax=Aequorivita echinoideorum TaxID=1549647 RepID=A0ABS5S1Y6_9FLAO|nr:ATP-binding cassette domain-containing protein [Aequorivita echinoideorum]MBT0607216.1 ATP-binding cassette domain-containing protein [Aequorivita echinoideorum]
MEKEITPWRRFVNLLKMDRRDIYQIVFYATFAGLVSLTLPLGIQAIINLIQGAQVSTSWIVLVVLVTLGVAFQGTLQIMQIRILENVQQKIFMRSSFEFAYRFPKIKLKELVNSYPPEMANRFFDTLTIQKGLAKLLLDFPTAIIQIVFGLILLSLYHPFFILYGFLLILFITLVFQFTSKKGLSTSLKGSKLKYKVAYWLQEVARSLLTFKLSGKTSLAMDRNDTLTDSYLFEREKHFKVLLVQFSMMVVFKVLVTAGLLLIGGMLVLNQQMNIGQFVAAEIIILLVITSVEKLITGLEIFYDVLTSLEKMGEVVDKELEPQEGINPFQNNGEVNLELKNISFTNHYGNEILKNIDFMVRPQDRIFIDGDPGAGKATFFKILAGLISPTFGSIYINDNSVKGIHPNAYRSVVGLVLPEQLPFEGTIRENICLGNQEIDQDYLNEILKNTRLLKFLKQQPNGLNTILQPDGQEIPRSVSSRIALARAIINKPKILVLKDTLTYFDKDEAKEVAEYLASKDRPWTLIISDSRNHWKRHCNRFYLLKDQTLKPIEKDA